MKTDKQNSCCNPHQVTAEFYDNIFGFVLKQIQDKEIAEDITQEVMGRMVEAYNSKQEVQNTKAWLFRVTRNIISDRYRKKDILQFDNSILESEKSENDFELMTEDYIVPMIHLLPEEYAKPLLLSDIDNLKHVEIAKKLDLSLSATKMRIQRARKKLYELFLECCDITYTENDSFAHCTIKTSCTPLLKEKDRLKKEK
ncbi:sigma-70 family RNA polymerase sigma factor [Halosquirtibacter laminarini]|uniref:Sigma-70 family RNA polymerase sigma factor n=1 Tax=Halosquirtibacter laminarini TaxID=3374600 RepID=A0AC61NRC5_9BACT|nr:sigma-70 family RNA polymerase sigma factor [Prolixibacteraceae bacterium]